MMKPKKLQELLSAFLRKQELDVVYGIGAFSGGHCVINENRVVVINKRMPVEEQLRILVSVILDLGLDYSGLKKEAGDYILRYIKP
ncbi:MAG: hypothetical protein U9Q91_07695 [Candidatus Marinimicrobia bacterium]|nr:hypothetical protein [Candidatus Neomarinimicrobiota bacterium]